MAWEGSAYPITAVAPTVASALGLRAPRCAGSPAVPAILRDLCGSGQVGVLAPDALGLTVWQHWRKQMPFLTSLHAKRHLVLRSVRPTMTPVNFAALVTGAEPEVHGLRNKDGELKCESLFDVVREAGGASAGVGNAGYTGGQFLARYADLSGRVHPPDDDAVVKMTLHLAREHTPHFIITQLGDPDHTFHRVGPTSPEAAPVIRDTDRRVREVVTGLCALSYGVIVLADHSQHDVPAEDPGEYRGWHDDLVVPEDALVPCTWVTTLEDRS